MKRRISFDFDGTIGHKQDVQEFAKECLKDPELEVFITTRRYGEEVANWQEKPNSDWWRSVGDKNWLEVYKLADKLGIERKNIHFCNMEAKEDYFRDGSLGDNIYLHLDDDQLEVEDINMNTKVYCLNVTEKNWKIKAIQLLNQK